jgi:hypothetical protein
MDPVCRPPASTEKWSAQSEKKVVSPAQEQFVSSWCLILYARREAGKAEIKPRILKRPRITSHKSPINGSICSPERLGLFRGVLLIALSMRQLAQGSNNREARLLSHSLTHPLVSRSRAFYNPGIT